MAVLNLPCFHDRKIGKTQNTDELKHPVVETGHTTTCGRSTSSRRRCPLGSVQVNQSNQVKRCENYRAAGEKTTTCTLHANLLLIFDQQAVGKITHNETKKKILLFVFDRGCDGEKNPGVVLNATDVTQSVTLRNPRSFPES